MPPDTSTPSWAVPVSLDKYGSFECANCGERVPTHWKACQKCCKHEEVGLYESENDYGYSYVQTECLICGKDWLDPKFILQNFELVRRKESN